jgi:hypothetical protein
VVLHLRFGWFPVFLLATTSLAAQQFSVDAGYATVRVPRTPTALAFLLAPAVRATDGRLSLFGSASGALLLNRGVGGRATAGASWSQPLLGVTSLDASITADALSYPDFDPTRALSGQLRLVTGGERESAFLGGALTRSWLGDIPRHGWRAEAGGGVSRTHWSANFMVARSDFVDLLQIGGGLGPSISLLSHNAFVDASGGVQVALPPGVLLDLTAGVRFDDPLGTGDGLAASGTITVPLVPGRLLFLAGAGRQWSDVVRGLPGGEFAYGSFRIAQIGARRLPPPALEATCVGPAPVLRARVRARSVEVQSDLTDWRSVTLLPVGNGVFEAVLATREGAARLLWKIDDGSWTPPPGLPISDSEFGGRTATVILPACRPPVP